VPGNIVDEHDWMICRN